MNERECILAARQGDQVAFGLLVQRHRRRLLALLWNMLGSVDDARDVAQEAFMQAFLKLDEFDSNRDFKAWLFAIAVNRSLDWLRRRKSFWNFFRRQSAEKSPPLFLPGEIGRIEESALLSPLLARLSRRERAVLLLKFNEGYRAGEIAAMLGCSEATVRVHLLNAKRKLKHALAGAPAAAAVAGEEAP